MIPTELNEDARTPEEQTLVFRRQVALSLARFLMGAVNIVYRHLAQGATPEEALDRSLLRGFGDPPYLRPEELGPLSMSQATERVLQRHRGAGRPAWPRRSARGAGAVMGGGLT